MIVWSHKDSGTLRTWHLVALAVLAFVLLVPFTPGGSLARMGFALLKERLGLRRDGTGASPAGPDLAPRGEVNITPGPGYS
jgi:hypothetical protein